MKEVGKVLLTYRTQLGRRESPRFRLPVGLLRKGQLDLFQLEDDAVTADDRRIRRRARTGPPAPSPPRPRILAPPRTRHAGLRAAEAAAHWAWD